MDPNFVPKRPLPSSIPGPQKLRPSYPRLWGGASGKNKALLVLLFCFFDSCSSRSASNGLSQSTIRALMAHRCKSVGGAQSWDMVGPAEAVPPGTWVTRSPPLDSRCLASLAGCLGPGSHDAAAGAPWFGAYREPSRQRANSTPASLRATATVAMNLPRRFSIAAAHTEIGSRGR